MTDGVFSELSDVYSYSVLLWEITSLGMSPFAHLRPQDVRRALLDGVRLEQATYCTDSMYELQSRCWLADPRQRPRFSDVRAALGPIVAAAESASGPAFDRPLTVSSHGRCCGTGGAGGGGGGGGGGVSRAARTGGAVAMDVDSLGGDDVRLHPVIHEEPYAGEARGADMPSAEGFLAEDVTGHSAGSDILDGRGRKAAVPYYDDDDCAQDDGHAYQHRSQASTNELSDGYEDLQVNLLSPVSRAPDE